MKSINRYLLPVMLTLLLGCSAKGDNNNEKRATIQQQRNTTLSELYKVYPNTRNEIAHAQGYATFFNSSSKIFVVGIGSGYGVVKDNHTQKDTYMKMAQAGAGVGIGVKQLRVVMVFHNREALNNFIKNGYVLGADASIAAKYGDTGGAPVSGSVNTVTPSAEKLDPPVNVYQLTEDGLSLQAMVDGYKYWPDTELN